MPALVSTVSPDTHPHRTTRAWVEHGAKGFITLLIDDNDPTGPAEIDLNHIAITDLITVLTQARATLR
jgi:hypothetical protein